MTPYHESDGVTLYHGDCLHSLRIFEYQTKHHYRWNEESP